LTGTVTLCACFNEDGFGPSALGSYVVKALVARWRSERREPLKVLLFNRGAEAFNRVVYADWPEVELRPVDGLLRLVKPQGEVHLGRTMETWAGYGAWREGYIREVAPDVAVCGATLDVGGPMMVAAAARAGKPAFSVFDHSWAATLRGLCRADCPRRLHAPPDSRAVKTALRVASEIEADERLASGVFLFDAYMCPPEFRDHWQALGAPVTILPGVFGQRRDPAEARSCLNRLLTELGQAPVGSDERLVLISPGGTMVWDDLLPRMIDGFLNQPSAGFTPVLSRPNVGSEVKARMRAAGRVRWFDYGPGATQQPLLPAFELVITRAGGGTVNDCLATRTALACVHEPFWQVALIERELRRRGWLVESPEADLDVFARDPAEAVGRLVAAGRPQVDYPPAGAEKVVAERLLATLGK